MYIIKTCYTAQNILPVPKELTLLSAIKTTTTSTAVTGVATFVTVICDATEAGADAVIASDTAAAAC